MSKYFNNLKYVVTGTGRCGTVYMARLLTSLNIPCGHEFIFNIYYPESLYSPHLSLCSVLDIKTKEKIPNWIDENEIVADSSYMAAPFLYEIPPNTKIIHITRNKDAVIRSFSKLNFFNNSDSQEIKDYEKFIFEHCPEINSHDAQEKKISAFYDLWNDLIRANSKNHEYIHFDIEELPNDRLFEFLNVEKSSNIFNDNKINSIF